MSVFRHAPRAGILAAVGLIAGATLLSGCTSGAATSSSGGAAVPGVAKGAPGNGGGAAGAATGTSGSTAAGTAPSDGRSLIVTAALQVRVTDATVAATRAQQAAVTAGGYVASESVGNGPQPVPTPETVDGTTVPQPNFPAITSPADAPQAVLVLRVPPGAVEPMLASLSGAGTVTYRNRASADVTGQVADVNSRVASAQAGIAELRTLISRASTVTDLVSLEDALSQRESDLESLEAQQRALADETQLATVSVEFFSQGAPVVAAAEHTGFVKGLLVGWHGLVDVVRGVLIALGWLLPFAGVAAGVMALLWFPVRWVLRRRRPTAE
jgi:hypothetical protein